VSRRTERVNSLIRAILARAIQTELHDPRIPPITSITGVDVSPDFALAKIHVSVFAPTDAKRQLAIRALQSSAGHLRWLLGHELQLRKLPTLVFKLDESIRKSFETLQVIDQLNLNAAAAEPHDTPDADSDGAACEDLVEGADGGETTLSRPDAGREEV
jgi:ribosome-binding factor A